MQVRRPQCCEEDVTSKCKVICRLCGPPVLRLAAGRNECSWKASATLGEAGRMRATKVHRQTETSLRRLSKSCRSHPNHNHRPGSTSCGLTLRSSGPPPARHLGREAVKGYRPPRGPSALPVAAALSSNVRPRKTDESQTSTRRIRTLEAPEGNTDEGHYRTCIHHP